MDKNKGIVLITDALQSPYDEGFRKFTYNFYHYLKKNYSADVIVLNDSDLVNPENNFKKINKLFFNLKFIKKIRKYKTIIYLPLSSVTFFSIIRAYILNIFSKNTVYIIGLQERKYKKYESRIIKKIKNIYYLLLNGIDNTNFQNVFIIESGVDTEKFHPITDDKTLEQIKRSFSIPLNKRIFLHVGHIKEGRNLNDLIAIQRNVNDCQVVLVGSTSTQSDDILKNNLIKNGIIVIDKYIVNIAELYNIADCYLFLVKKNDNFITQPLSVLEALACGIPVISYSSILGGRFKSISKGLNYFDNIEEVMNHLNQNNGYIDQSKSIISEEVSKYYSWNEVIKSALEEIKKVC